ncbi:retron system putative HNH endonuclease [Endozoicomonas sp. 4G]|uniref:retron system putative HNH endonuclease n=1 Tax=Endozoicomonas sp. 4G TaxID=2872754 RepID=UPI002078B182|nr:retron system putative HNH endonuclease [Endozoicomonas sp. 4G]
MKQLTHPLAVPRQLQRRQQQAVDDPRTAWQRFRGKAEIYDALLPAQRHLCAYCEVELDNREEALGYHIEHIESKSGNPLLTFEFHNLMLSCFKTGNEAEQSNEDLNPVSCGHSELKRNNQYDASLFIKPTEQDCQRYFFYELDGRVVPHPDLNETEAARADHTIEVLNLNCLRLQRDRGDMIREGLEIISDLADDDCALKCFLHLELNEIATNKLFAFHTTRCQFFQDLA